MEISAVAVGDWHHVAVGDWHRVAGQRVAAMSLSVTGTVSLSVTGTDFFGRPQHHQSHAHGEAPIKRRARRRQPGVAARTHDVRSEIEKPRPVFHSG